MRDYMAEGWAEIFSDNGFTSFEAIWDSCDEWVEEPNHHVRRGGWNAVARKVLRTRDRKEVGVYVKVHSDLCRRTLLHPIRGEPVLARELRSNLRCVALGVRCAPPLYFAARRVRGESRAIFISEELAGHEPLNEVVSRWGREGWPGPGVRTALAASIAAEFRKVHEGGLVAVYFVPKHIFVKRGAGPGGIDPHSVGVIDLERMRKAGSPDAARLRDLKRLHEAAPEWSRTDRIRFLKGYDRSRRLTPEAKALWRALRSPAG